MTKNPNELAVNIQLADMATSIGLETAQDMATFDAASKTRREALALAKDSVSQDTALDVDKGVQAFNAPRIRNLSRLGQKFGTLFNDPTSRHARDAARMAAGKYMEAATGRGERSLNGGVLGNYAYVILCGSESERVRRALQDRLDYWQGQKTEAAAVQDAASRAELMAEAMRYLQPAGQAPDAKGNPIVEDGKIRTPKHNGRPAKTVHGIKIPRGGATPRDSQLGQFASMFLQYGENVLTPEFVDSWLDNGGKWKGDSDTPEAHANTALAAIEKLLMAGGSTSADAASLTATRMFLTRIASEGLAKNKLADAPVVAAPVVEVPVVEVPVVEVPDEVEALLSAALPGDETPKPVESAPEPAPEPAPTSRRVRRAAVNAARPGM